MEKKIDDHFLAKTNHSSINSFGSFNFGRKVTFCIPTTGDMDPCYDREKIKVVKAIITDKLKEYHQNLENRKVCDNQHHN